MGGLILLFTTTLYDIVSYFLPGRLDFVVLGLVYDLN